METKVTNNQCLSFLLIELRHIHLPAPQLGDWSYNELNPNCLYADTKINENHFTLLLDVIGLEFLDRNTFSYFLIVITPVFPNPSF